MLILELGDIVDVLVNHDPQAIALGMRCHVVLAEYLRHDDVWKSGDGELCEEQETFVGI